MDRNEGIIRAFLHDIVNGQEETLFQFAARVKPGEVLLREAFHLHKRDCDSISNRKCSSRARRRREVQMAGFPKDFQIQYQIRQGRHRRFRAGCDRNDPASALL